MLIPSTAIVLGIVIAACFRLARIRLLLVTGVLWILYGIYESLMHFRILCSGECNIRVDLLLIYPVLLVYTATAAFRLGLALRRKSRGMR